MYHSFFVSLKLLVDQLLGPVSLSPASLNSSMNRAEIVRMSGFSGKQDPGDWPGQEIRSVRRCGRSQVTVASSTEGRTAPGCHSARHGGGE